MVRGSRAPTTAGPGAPPWAGGTAPRRGPVPGPAGAGLAKLYAAVVAHRNRRFDAGRGVITFDRPVISIGNLSVGGTGKTPITARLARWLIDAGLQPCIAMRGYAARGGRSDEAAEYDRLLPGTPVVARPDRAAGLIDLFATDSGRAVRCVLLDDGFQHRRIARQLDIVTLDATADPFADRELPAGWLREPVASVARAGALVVTHAESAGAAAADRLLARVMALAPGAIGAITEHRWEGLRRATPSDRDEPVPVSALARRRVLAVCAIGNPRPFFASAMAAVGGTVSAITLRDHDPYRPGTVRRIALEARDADYILTTEKDWSKLSRVPAAAWPCPVLRPVLSMHFVRGGAALKDAVVGAASAPDLPFPDP